MTAITENSIAQITLPVGTTAQFDAHKVAGFTGWNTDLGALVTCPGDGARFVAVGAPKETIRSESGSVFVSGGYALLNFLPEDAIPAGTLVEGSFFEIEATANPLTLPDDGDLVFGISQNAEASSPSTVYILQTIGHPSVGRWNSFSEAEVLLRGILHVGAISSGTSRYVNAELTAIRSDTGESLYTTLRAWTIDTAVPLYPHMAIRLHGGTMYRTSYIRRLYIP